MQTAWPGAARGAVEGTRESDARDLREPSSVISKRWKGKAKVSQGQSTIGMRLRS